MPRARTIQHGYRRARRAATNPTDRKEIRMRLVATLVLGLLLGGALPARAATVTFDVDDAGEAPDSNTGDGLCHTAPSSSRSTGG